MSFLASTMPRSWPSTTERVVGRTVGGRVFLDGDGLARAARGGRDRTSATCQPAARSFWVDQALACLQF